jgi:hypothetical protein
MADLFELYKPLRNHLRQLNLIDSLRVIHAYMQHLQFSRPLPDDIYTLPFFRNAKTRLEKCVFEWELDTLSLELLVNAIYPDSSLAADTLRRWDCLAGAINKLKTLENGLVSHYPAGSILREIHRLAHRQFPWQRSPDTGSIARYFKLFSRPDLHSIIGRTLGLTARDLYRLGLALTGHFLSAFALEYPPRIEIPGLSRGKLDLLLDRIARPTDHLRQLARDRHVVDATYAYLFNPLREYPLARQVLNGREYLLAPIPTFLFRRFTEGIYYEVNRETGFAEAFGKAFQDYIGEVISRAITGTTLLAHPEVVYRVGKNRKDTADWLIIDNTTVLFIECKTKRLRLEAKTDIESPETLERDLATLVLSLMQLYKTIRDYQLGHYPNVPVEPNKKIFPVVVTLEDWFAFGPEIIREVDRRLHESLVADGIDPAVARDMPYSIVSAADFERLVQVVAITGIGPVLTKKTVDPEPRQWVMDAFLRHDFSVELTMTSFLFPEVMEQIVPEGQLR